MTSIFSLIVNILLTMSSSVNSVMKWFLMVACFMSLLMYINMDPMKGSFFLVLGLIFVAPTISMNFHVWYSYYVCLLFLSGVFVILVYFSSLSKFIYLRKPLWGVGVLFSGLAGLGLVEFFCEDFVGMNNFYYDVYWLVFILIIVVLLVFMNFMSYMLSLGVAIRKM